VDAAYGGFYRLLAGAPDGLDPAPWAAVAAADSVVVDPHKHGLQPYGCGAVLFRDPSVGRYYRHDSPYTYFTSEELHLGEISLECSRAGAAAAALWLTLELFPLTADGLGRVLAANLRAARRFATLVAEADELVLHQPPELDIVTYFPAVDPPASSAVDAASAAVMRAGMSAAEDPLFLSVLQVDADRFARRHPDVVLDSAGARVLRSVLMKPEHELYVDRLAGGVRDLAGRVLSAT
jgi:glutamate/tyrosine decarboxylase-like PLP-dependent enzyme